MEEAKKVRIVREFDAPVEKVWAAFSQPELVRQWWGPKDFTAPSVQMDFKEGGTYLFCMRGQVAPNMPAQDFWSGGTYVEIVPNKRLVYIDHFADEHGSAVSPSAYGMVGMPDDMRVSMEFETIDGGRTRLTLVHEGAPSGEQEKDNMVVGWNQSLDKLAESIQ